MILFKDYCINYPNYYEYNILREWNKNWLDLTWINVIIQELDHNTNGEVAILPTNYHTNVILTSSTNAMFIDCR